MFNCKRHRSLDGIFTLQLSFLPIIMIFTSSLQNDSRKFNLEIRDYGEAAGITIYYILDEQSVQVDLDCELANCKRRTAYKAALSKQQGDSVYFYLQSLHLDTLHDEYKSNQMIDDGLVRSIKLSGTSLPTKSTTLDNRETPATDSLFKIVAGFVRGHLSAK